MKNKTAQKLFLGLLLGGFFGIISLFIFLPDRSDDSFLETMDGKKIEAESWIRRCELDGGFVKWFGSNNFECIKDGEIINHQN
jgi:hypothetical protein